jgi:hypothetical protein
MHKVKTSAGRFASTLVSAAFLGAFLVSLAPLGACATGGVRPAPFRVRPDSVHPGSLRGPFDGQVVDAETGRPVAKAQVYAVWSYVEGFAFNSPAGVKEWIGQTDQQGRYHVPALASVPRGKRLASVRLIIYKRGYVAYRSDRRFEDFGPRLDFTQKGNEVRLERWSSDISHVKHLRYVGGGGGALVELVRLEVPEAAAELAGRPSSREAPGGPVVGEGPGPGEGGEGGGGPAAGGAPPPVDKLLTGDDIKQVTGYEGGFDVGDLGDEEPSARYGNVHFRAKNKGEDWDVAVRVWVLPAGELLEHWNALVEQLPNTKETDDIPDKSLRAVSPKGDILGVAFVDEKRGVVVLVQCGASQCRSGDVVVAIARKVKERVDALLPVVQP